MVNLLDLEFNRLVDFVNEIGEPKFRAKQIFSWLSKGVSSFDEMANLPKSLREKLEKESYIGCHEILKVQESKLDGTRKYLFGLSDGNAIESVFMKYKFGNSICVSSQAGCRMGCKFCASTIGGLKRNLTAGEIYEEVLRVQKDTGERINHIVVMGTGEPFDNYENVASFIKLVNDENGLNIGMRNITVSTCGIVPKIKDFAKDFPQVNLAISLHHTNDLDRSSLMPINKKYPIPELIRAVREYIEMTARRVTFEYTLVKGKNDSEKDANDLAKLLHGMLCHVNLIPLNVVKENGFETTLRDDAIRFQKCLEAQGIECTIRREIGDDIDAACGQLRLGQSPN